MTPPTTIAAPRQQRRVYEAVYAHGKAGATSTEAAQRTRLTHGATSAALTRLHRAGHLARLTERRNGSTVYVIPDWTAGRPVAPASTPRTRRLTPQQALVAARATACHHHQVSVALPGLKTDDHGTHFTVMEVRCACGHVPTDSEDLAVHLIHAGVLAAQTFTPWGTP